MLHQRVTRSLAQSRGIVTSLASTSATPVDGKSRYFSQTLNKEERTVKQLGNNVKQKEIKCERKSKGATKRVKLPIEYDSVGVPQSEYKK